MYSKSTFKRKLIASAVASVALTSLSGMVAAQSDDNSMLEEVVVTGIRASLDRAMDIKRDSSGVVDSISAEDIGKFPDTNLAESLQRITGVSIDRENGEGSKVTVRGFGPDYNMVTLNGRSMPTAAASPNGISTSRAFDFSQLAAEVVSGVDVHKTSRADIASGGIGATINVKTARPLDNPGLKLSVGLKAIADTSNINGDDVTPKLTGLFSWTDDNEMFGVGLAVSHEKRDSGTVGSYVTQWQTNKWTNSTYAGVDILNEPAVGDLYSTPTDIRYTIGDRERTRDNAQLVLQFRPMDNLTGTLDYTYAKNDIEENRSEQSIWFLNDPDHLEFDSGVVKTPIVFSEDVLAANKGASKDLGLAQQARGTSSELKSLGLNVSWDITDNFNVTLDAHHSTAETSPDLASGFSWDNFGMGANIVGHQIGYFNDTLPRFVVDGFSDCRPKMNCNGTFEKADVGSQVNQGSFSLQKNDIDQVRLNGTYTFDNGSFEFGVESRTTENNTQFSQTTDIMGNWALSNPGDVSSKLSMIDFPSEFDEYDASPAGLQDFSAVYKGNAEELGRLADKQYKFGFGPAPLTTDDTVKEEVDAAFFQVAVDGELGNMTTHTLAGVRYETTDITSTSLVREPTSIDWLSDNDFLINNAATTVTYVDTASYDHLLPNFDFSVDLREDLKARFSYSKTIARPTYNYLTASISVDQPTRPTINNAGLTNAVATANDPGLVPLESSNFDLSLEWYYGDASYVSVGFYEKRVDNFIGTKPVDKPQFGLRDVTNGPRAQAAVAALNAKGEKLSDQNIYTMVVAQENGLDYDTLDPLVAEANYTVKPNANDPLYQFSTNTPVNNKEAKIYGSELAIQHFFGETGFGVQANYTTVQGDVGFDVAGDPDVAQFAVTGLSDTANLVLIYDKNDIQARLAYNWRDKFLNNANRFANNPAFTEAHSQLDLNVSYDLTDQFSVSLEGINLTGEGSRIYNRTENQLWNYSQGSPRYQIGARYTF